MLFRSAPLLETMHRIAGNTSNDGYWGYENPRLTMPFSAPALLELCLAAPGRLKTFRGRRRGLARRVMQNLLPPKILWRTDKMPFAPDYHSRYQQSRDAARSMLDAVSQDADVAQIIDFTELRRRLDQSNALFDEMHIVPYTLDTATFLNILTLVQAFAITGAKQ